MYRSPLQLAKLAPSPHPSRDSKVLITRWIRKNILMFERVRHRLVKINYEMNNSLNKLERKWTVNFRFSTRKSKMYFYFILGSEESLCLHVKFVTRAEVVGSARRVCSPTKAQNRIIELNSSWS